MDTNVPDLLPKKIRRGGKTRGKFDILISKNASKENIKQFNKNFNKLKKTK